MENFTNQLPVYGNKISFSSKVANWWRRLGFFTKIVAVLAVTAVSLTAYATQSFQAAQIALIVEGGPVPVTPPLVTPSPSPIAPTCTTQVYSAEVTKPCSSQGFYYVNYSCTDGRQYSLGDGKSCFDLSYAAQEASQKCGILCSLPASPAPTMTASPTAIPAPSPSAPARVPPPGPPATDGCKYVPLPCVTEPCPMRLICDSIVVPTATPTSTPVPTFTPTPSYSPTPTPRPTTFFQTVTNTISTYRCRMNLLRKMSWAKTKSECR